MLLSHANATIGLLPSDSDLSDASSDRRIERARETAVAVVRAIEVQTDAQALVCLEALQQNGGTCGSFMCDPLSRYFQRCQKDFGPSWRLNEILHLKLLRIQRADPRSIDAIVLLRGLRCVGVLRYTRAVEEFIQEAILKHASLKRAFNGAKNPAALLKSMRK